MTILDMFASSPVKPLQSHMASCLQATENLVVCLKAANKAQWPQAQAAADRVCDAEHDADDIKRELRANLPNSLFMALPRADLLGLLKAQEKIPNLAKDIVGLVVGRKLIVPKVMAAEVLRFAQQSEATVKHASRAIGKLGRLMKIGFKGVEVDRIRELIATIDQLESETDNSQIALCHLLFGMEKEMPPIDVMFLYRMLEQIGTIADHAQDVAGRIDLLLAR